MLAVADASAMPGLRRALSPDSIDLVAVASTPVSVLAQLRRTSPDVVVVDLRLSQCDVFQLIGQLVQEHTSVLALASGEQAASLTERALDAGASDVVERRSEAGSWHEESGSPHVLSLRVLAIAAAARPRPSRLSLRLGPAATPQPSAAAQERASAAPRTGQVSLRTSPLPAAEYERVSLSLRASPLSAASRGHAAASPPPGTESLRASPLSAADPHKPTPVAPQPGTESLRASPLSAAGRERAPASPLPGSESLRASPLSAAEMRERGPVGPGQGASPLSAVESRGGGPVGGRAMRVSPLPGTEVARGSSSVPARALSGRAPRSSTVQPPMAAYVELVALGASTGGTLALAELLKAMPKNAPPMLVVQHMLPEFTSDFAERLNDLCQPDVRVAVDGEPIEQGAVLLAPGGRHLRVRRDAEQRLRVRVTDDLPVGKHRPSVDVLFQACAETSGNAAVGVLLTGMGDDGARGLLALHNVGARTLVQDQASSVCFGMPSAAIALGAAQQVLPLREIAHTLRELVKTQSSLGA